MPRQARELSALAVRRLKHVSGRANVTYAVGGVAGLLLQISPNNSRSWILRAMVSGRRSEIGLGTYPDVTLAQARDLARELRFKIAQGVDPIFDRREQRAAREAEYKRKLSFAEAVEHCLASKTDGFRNQKHRDQWLSTLVTYAFPILGKIDIQSIDVPAVLRVLNQPYGDTKQTLWATRTETASRLRGRIEAVLSWATAAGHRKGDNPARWAGNLRELLPPAAKIKRVTNQPAIQIDEIPIWFSLLQSRDGVGSRALEFVTLTAARSGEVRGATWAEIDFGNAIWTIPAARMKMDREHRVPLTAEALIVLNKQPRNLDNDLVFSAPRGGELSDMTLSATMKRMHQANIEAGGKGFVDRVSGRAAVPHGLRSSFRDWVADRTSFPSEMAEIALAHRVGNSVESAYRRGDMIEKRREMMSAWASYILRKC